eukprot:Nk52_evm3s357 gene=Nk52_evmTU3s357
MTAFTRVEGNHPRTGDSSEAKNTTGVEEKKPASFQKAALLEGNLNQPVLENETAPNPFNLTHRITAGLTKLYETCVQNSSNENYERERQQNQKASYSNPMTGLFSPGPGMPLMGERYQFVEIIGKGTFAVLVKARDTFSVCNRCVAIKVMNVGYEAIGVHESKFLKKLGFDDFNHYAPIVTLLNTFTFYNHYCLVFELLSPIGLVAVVKQRSQSLMAISMADSLSGGVPLRDTEATLKVVRKIAFQLLSAMVFLKKEGLIHADLKPENILVSTERGTSSQIKLVDFGNALHDKEEEITQYFDTFEIQSMFYRAPEVFFGMKFGSAIDMWSVGCIIAELFLGRPLFDGPSKEQCVHKIYELLGPFPRAPFGNGKFLKDFHPLLDENEVMDEEAAVSLCRKRLCSLIDHFKVRDMNFVSFIDGLLQYDPEKRLKPLEALCHPFMATCLPLRHLLNGNDYLDLLTERSNPQDHLYESVGLDWHTRYFSAREVKLEQGVDEQKHIAKEQQQKEESERKMKEERERQERKKMQEKLERQEEQQRQAKEKEARRVQEEKERKLEEERSRIQEEKERKLKEGQRRIQEEKERKLREEEEERRTKEEKERRIKEEKKRQLKEEKERKAEERKEKQRKEREKKEREKKEKEELRRKKREEKEMERMKRGKVEEQRVQKTTTSKQERAAGVGDQNEYCSGPESNGEETEINACARRATPQSSARTLRKRKANMGGDRGGEATCSELKCSSSRKVKGASPKEYVSSIENSPYQKGVTDSTKKRKGKRIDFEKVQAEERRRTSPRIQSPNQEATPKLNLKFKRSSNSNTPSLLAQRKAGEQLTNTQSPDLSSLPSFLSEKNSAKTVSKLKEPELCSLKNIMDNLSESGSDEDILLL